MRRSLKDSCDQKLTVQNDVLIGMKARRICIINVSKTAPTGDRSHCSMVWLYDWNRHAFKSSVALLERMCEKQVVQSLILPSFTLLQLFSNCFAVSFSCGVIARLTVWKSLWLPNWHVWFRLSTRVQRIPSLLSADTNGGWRQRGFDRANSRGISVHPADCKEGKRRTGLRSFDILIENYRSIQ